MIKINYVIIILIYTVFTNIILLTYQSHLGKIGSFNHLLKFLTINPNSNNNFNNVRQLIYNNSTKSNNNTVNYNSTPPSLEIFCRKVGGVNGDKTQLPELITEFMCNNTNLDIINNYLLGNPKCFSTFQKLINGDFGSIDFLSEAFNWSGKGINDIGSQNECLGYPLKYFFIELSFNTTFNYSDFDQIYYFLTMDKSLWGLCFFPECEDFVVNYFDSKVNTKFKDYLNTIGINNFTNYNKISSTNSTNNTNSTDGQTNYKEEIVTDTLSNIFKLLFYFTFVILTFQLLTSFFGHFVFDEEEKEQAIKPLKEKSSESLQTNSKERSDTYLQTNTSMMEKLYKFLSINRFFRRLTTIRNKYFNDTDLEVLGGVKTILLFLFTFFQLNLTISQLPRRNTGTYYYSSLSFSLVKFSTYSLESIVCINGIICGFKLMNIYKKEKEIQFGTIFKFFLGSLTKILIFHYIFFLFYYFMEDLGKLFNFTLMTDFFVNHCINPKTCIRNYFTSYIPFYYQYAEDSTNEVGFDACFKFFQLLYCEFYCFVGTLLLFYFISRFKSSLFDILFSVSILASTILSYFLYISITDFNKLTFNIYKLVVILGETRIYKESHILYFVYFIGLNCGICYFYFKDMVSNHPIQNNRKYLPFRYNLSIMNFFYKISGMLKLMFVLFLISVILFFSFSYNIFLSFTSYTRHNNLIIDMNTPLYIFYIFEKKLYIVAFAALILVLLINSKNNLLKSLFSCEIFVMSSRLSFCYICLVESFTYLFYSFNEMQTYLNIETLLYITAALFFLLIISSILLVMVYEMPLRMLVKKITKRKVKKVEHSLLED